MFEKYEDSTESSKWWLGLAAYILIADTLSRETLSSGYHRGTEHKIGRFAVRAAALTTILHLERAIPPEYDPYHRVADGIAWVGEKLDEVLE